MSEIPYRYDVTHTAAQVGAAWGHLEGEAESGDIVSVAGRVMYLRDLGKAVFAKLVDSSGSIQLFADERSTADLAGFAKLNLGDWIGARGEVVRTRRGELSVKVSEWVLLAEARRSFGDKWRGISDVETDVYKRQALAPLGPVSVDTVKVGVARAAVEAGATLINDVSGTLWPVAAECGVGWVAMHRQGTAAQMQVDPRYDDVVAEVHRRVLDLADRAADAGVGEVLSLIHI